ncbi:MAG: hypothetical protein WA941_23460 [Nitrososphaeraceae archaeon]
MLNNSSKKIVVLFDEYGTPSFDFTTGQNVFLGVAVLYELNEEENIFKSCNKCMGLSRSKELKNDKIDVNRAIEISCVIGEQRLSILARYILLDNRTLNEIVEDYKKFGDISRQLFRGIKKERKVAQILYQQILAICISQIILRYLENADAGNYEFEIFVDYWDYPLPDKHIDSKYFNSLLEDKVQRFVVDNIKKDVKVSIKTKQFLKATDRKREYFIGVLTSVVSRVCRDEKDSKYDLRLLTEMQNKLGNNFNIEDTTNDLISALREGITVFIQETKEKDKKLLIY